VARMGVSSSAPQVCVFAPAPILTVTIERGVQDAGELHIHPGGQGFWVARMLRSLETSALLCAPLGGETGDVFGHLLGRHDFDVRVVPVAEPSGAYVHDRRDGERREWWQATLSPLGRHEVDDLYTTTMAAALEAGVCVLTGTHRQDSVLPEGTFARLAADLRANGVFVVVDLQGALLRESLDGGTDLLKVSEEELVEDGWAAGSEDTEVITAVERLTEAGAADIVVSRAAGGALALLDGTLLRATGPQMTAIDPSGAGDSMTAALASARASDMPAVDGLRLAVAAGAMNVTRHGLGSGDAEAIAQLAENVQVERIGGRSP
jgi:1-phosphofructokinase